MVQVAEKSELRVRLRRLRRQLAADHPDAAERAGRLLMLDQLPAVAWMAAYHAVGAEMDPSAVRRKFARSGCGVALPFAEAPGEPLTFRAWSPGQGLVEDAMGVPAPGPDAARITPDVLVVPLLAFDRAGGRLGQGGGHYDRTIADLRTRTKVFVLGLAYAGQELLEIPMEAHDQRLDAILTETEYIEVA